jgi:cysteine desulfurase
MVDRALEVDGVEVVGAPEPAARLPHLACLGVHGVEAEPVLIGLDRAGVAVHSGSACSSESIEPSPVLEAMGVDPSHSLRVSVGWTTTDEDGAAFTDAFARVVAELRALRG